MPRFRGGLRGAGLRVRSGSGTAHAVFAPAVFFFDVGDASDTDAEFVVGNAPPSSLSFHICLTESRAMMLVNASLPKTGAAARLFIGTFRTIDA